MGIYELPILSGILHTGADAAPHCSVRLRIDTVMSGTCRGEVDVAAMLRMNSREDMVEQCTLVEIGILLPQATYGITPLSV